jgi:hypothetical protein
MKSKIGVMKKRKHKNENGKYAKIFNNKSILLFDVANAFFEKYHITQAPIPLQLLSENS